MNKYIAVHTSKYGSDHYQFIFDGDINEYLVALNYEEFVRLLKNNGILDFSFDDGDDLTFYLLSNEYTEFVVIGL